MKNLRIAKESFAAWPFGRAMKSLLAAPVAVVASVLTSASAPAQLADSPVQRLNAVMPEPDAPITAARQRAYQLFRAVAGVPVPIDDPRLAQMENLISAGNERGAVKIATRDPLFINVLLRDVARQMATRDETVRAPLSDFVATFVGAARDDVDARELLQGNFTYRADTSRTVIDGAQKIRNDLLADIVRSNNHYADIESNNFSLHSVLIKVDGQMITTDNNQDTVPIVNTDAAGLITTRAFLEAHAIAGTNRRLVEFSFRQFMCVPMEEWMDAGRPDDMVGRDVDRFPGGSNEKYQVTCKACHTQMDAFRQAFASTDFVNNKIVLNANVVGKMNRNAGEFPEGYATTNNKWVNYATGPRNTDQFGWRTESRGQGMHEFGRLLANSKGFSRCMTKRLFKAICKRAPAATEDGLVRAIADDFEQTYKLKDLAELVAVSPACLAKH